MNRLLVLLVLVAGASRAAARPSVTIAGDAPFSERELGEAVELRVPHDIAVHVRPDAEGRLVVEVGDRIQVIELDTHDPRAAARVVAMVVVALVDGGAPAPVAVEQPPGLSTPVIVEAPHPRPSRSALRVFPTAIRDDGGYTHAILNAALHRSLSPNTRVVATLGFGSFHDNTSREQALPIRLGFEGTAGALGIELGGYAIPYLSACGGPTTPGITTGVYGAVRVYFPLGKTTRIALEGGGQYKLGTAVDAMCFGPLEWQSYAGWVGAGVEWSL